MPRTPHTLPRRQTATLALAIVAAAVVNVTGAMAQVAVKAAGADGRFTVALDPKTAVPGFSNRQVDAFRQSLESLTDRMAAMPEVNAPGAPLCLRLSSWIEVQSESGLLEASVDVSRPVRIDGRCTELMGATVQVWLNRADSLLTSRLKVGASPDGEPWYVLPITRERDGFMAIEDDGEQIEVYAHGGAPFLVPVTWTEFSAGVGASIWTQADYDAWLAHDYRDLLDAARRESAANGSSVSADLRSEILAAVEEGFAAQAEMMRSMIGQPRAQMEQLTGRPFSQPPRTVPTDNAVSDSRDQMACWIEHRAQASTDCPAHSRLLRVNPGYFDLERPDQVQLVLVRTATNPESEDGAAYAGRRAIWDALDRGALAALARR